MSIGQRKNLKTANHHWWPQALAENWRDSSGLITQSFPDGRSIRQKDLKKIGGVKNAHHIKFTPEGSVWDESFEHIFDRIDNKVPCIIDELINNYELLTIKNQNKKYCYPLFIDECFFENVQSLIFSLITRSPWFRQMISNSISQIYAREGIEEYRPGDAALGLNLRDSLIKFEQELLGDGKIIFLIAEDGEYIFGDGFLNNFNHPTEPPLQPKVLLPLLPKIAIIYCRPSSFVPEPKGVVLNLKSDEVHTVNQYTMIYSGQCIFSRNVRPTLSEYFQKNMHLSIPEYHMSEINKIIQYCRNFRGY